jgi:hypothetical protein
MGRTFYPHSENTGPTMTVAQLIQLLSSFPPDAPVIFRSPKYGAFGSETAYSIDAAEYVQMPGKEEHFPAGISIDHETGEEEPYEAWVQIFHPWNGVVIA